ncbi:MAG: hypothetical protein ABIS67_07810, partial [Candidatus Eisenbacteria bacterium]
VSALTNYLKWTRGGRELIYLGFDGNTVMAVGIETSPAFRAGPPRRLFRLPTGKISIDVADDGERFVMTSAVRDGSSRAATVVMNWPALFARTP